MKSNTAVTVAGMLTGILLGTGWLNAAEAPAIKLQVQDNDIQIVTDANAPSYYLEYRTPEGAWQKWNAGQTLDNAQALWFRAVFETGEDIMLYEPPTDVDTFYSTDSAAGPVADGQVAVKIGSLSEDGSVTASAALDWMSEADFVPPPALADIPTPANNQAYATPDPGTVRLYWHSQQTGRVSIWHLSQEGTRKAGLQVHDEYLTTDWRVAGVGDIDSDGTDDIVWHNQAGGRAVIWFLEEDGVRYSGQSVHTNSLPPVWTIAAVKDMDNDGTPDLVWLNEDTNRVSIWFLNADGTRRGGVSVHDENLPLDWLLSGAADINGDGYPDLVWRNRFSNRVAIWLLDSAGAGTRASGVTVHDVNLPTSWTIAGLADSDGDGTPDIFWRNLDSNRATIWFLNADGTRRDGTTVHDSNLPTAWLIAGIADVNGDSNPDIIWRNQDTNRVSVWYLNSLGSRLDGNTVHDTNLETSWQISAVSE